MLLFLKCDLLISHQTGATLADVLDHIMEFTARMKLCMATQIANRWTPVFQDLRADVKKETRIRSKAIRFATGTRGYVGSIMEVTRCC